MHGLHGKSGTTATGRLSMYYSRGWKRRGLAQKCWMCPAPGHLMAASALLWRLALFFWVFLALSALLWPVALLVASRALLALWVFTLLLATSALFASKGHEYSYCFCCKTSWLPCKSFATKRGQA
eukprot:5614727-Amphidinium_carterae.4